MLAALVINDATEQRRSCLMTSTDAEGEELKHDCSILNNDNRFSLQKYTAVNVNVNANMLLS